MAAHLNGYSSDCGAPGDQPYNYHFANKDETSSSSSDQSSSHLSFLYDRAQGNSYEASPSSSSSAAAARDPSTVSNKTHERCFNAGNDKGEKCVDGGRGISRAIPAPSYPYTPPPPPQSNRQHPSPEESMACPSGTTTSSVNRQSTEDRGRQETDRFIRQTSELKISQQRNNCAPVTSPQQSSKGHEGRRVTGSQGGVVYKCPAATQHVDQRRNHVRQSIPWKDINSARKFSVPINLSRSRVQMTEFSMDDQQTTKGRVPDGPWSAPRPLAAGEVDKTSVRQLLREGDEIGNYDQTSIRYTGRTNPSKSFRFLQSVTGSSDSLSIEHHQAEKRRQKREEMLSSAAAAAEGCSDGLRDADDVVDISYIGSKIPSRTFRSLQEAIGARDHQVRPLPSPSVGAFHNYSDCSPSFDLQPTRTVKVIHLRPQKSLENLIGDF